MSILPKPNCIKCYDVYQWPSENGLNYDRSIDSAIFDELFTSKQVSSGELNRRTERTLHRRITHRTYYNHLQILVDDGLLTKKDTGERGKMSVFYSLSPDAKRRQKLHLLRTDPLYNTVKHMYAYLLFKCLVSRSGISLNEIKTRLVPAFEALLGEGLISLNNNGKYVVDDAALRGLLTDISKINRIARDRGKSAIIMGYLYQRGCRTRSKEDIDFEIIVALNSIKEKHERTLAKFSFLSDVIQIYCPYLYPHLPFRELMTF
jgi:DNA-binding transcriptional ArsR family regulator